MNTAPGAADRATGSARSDDDKLIDVVRDTVQQLEDLTQRLNSYLEEENWNGE